jgi:hypothetical protein
MRATLTRRLPAAPLALAVAGLLAACTTPHPPGSPHAGPQASTVPSGQLTAPASPRGLIPAPHGLTDRLVLRNTRVIAGTPIRGTLLVSNRSGRAINLNRGCRPSYEVALTSPRYTPSIAFAADCSVQPFIIRPGTNRLPVTVQTTYLACSATGSSAGQVPRCRHGNRMPPLPAGRYDAVLFGDGLPLPAPAGVIVILRA